MKKSTGRQLDLTMLLGALCEKGLGVIEEKQGLRGLREHMGPIVNKHVKRLIGEHKIDIPDEAVALYALFYENRKVEGASK